jgi:hypothetical protein
MTPIQQQLEAYGLDSWRMGVPGPYMHINLNVAAEAVTASICNCNEAAF